MSQTFARGTWQRPGGNDEARPQAEGGLPPFVSEAGPARVEGLRADMAARAAGIHAAEAELVDLVGQVARDGGWCGPGLRSVGHWGSIELGIASHTVNDMAATAERLRSLPRLAEEFAAGRLGFDKVRAVAGAASPPTDAEFVNLALAGTVEQVRRICCAYRRENPDPDANRADAKAQRQGRGLWHDRVPDRDGLVRIVARLAPDDAAVVMAAVRAHADALWRDQHGQTDPDSTDADRTEADAEPEPVSSLAGAEGDGEAEPQPFEARAALMADGLVLLAETGLAAGPTPVSGGERAEVVLHVDAEWLAGDTDVGRSHVDQFGPTIPRDAARRMACDCRVSVMVAKALGRPLGVGDASRTPPRWLRRALHERDGGCAFPGCPAARFVQAHHIVHWPTGATDIWNLVLLCRKHHRALHEGGYTVVLHTSGRAEFFRPDGRPVMRPPQRAAPESTPWPKPDIDPGASDGGRTDWSLDDALIALASVQRASAPPV